MLFREIIAVCSETHTNHINVLSRQNVELLNVKESGVHSFHYDLNVSTTQLQVVTTNGDRTNDTNKLL